MEGIDDGGGLGFQVGMIDGWGEGGSVGEGVGIDVGSDEGALLGKVGAVLVVGRGEGASSKTETSSIAISPNCETPVITQNRILVTARP